MGWRDGVLGTCRIDGAQVTAVTEDEACINTMAVP